MKVAVFGATGSTGRLVVECALSAGYFVSAFVREPKRMELAHRRLTIVKGDVMDPSSVAPVVQDADAVICTLGVIPQSKATGADASPAFPFALWARRIFWRRCLAGGALS